MRRIAKRGWFGVVLVLILLGTLFVIPANRYRMSGFIRGESFYQGLPVSYWTQEVEKWEHTWKFDDRTLQSVWHRRPANWEAWWVARFIGSDPAAQDTLPLLQGDSQAVAVLIELLGDPDWKIRWIAAEGLGIIGPAARSAFPGLHALVDLDAIPNMPYLQLPGWEDEEAFHHFAARALHRIDPEAAVQARVKNPRHAPPLFW